LLHVEWLPLAPGVPGCPGVPGLPGWPEEKIGNIYILEIYHVEIHVHVQINTNNVNNIPVLFDLL
jgi:hypothetical protein